LRSKKLDEWAAPLSSGLVAAVRARVAAPGDDATVGKIARFVGWHSSTFSALLTGRKLATVGDVRLDRLATLLNFDGPLLDMTRAVGCGLVREPEVVTSEPLR
jgi:hypothetical protein